MSEPPGSAPPPPPLPLPPPVPVLPISDLACENRYGDRYGQQSAGTISRRRPGIITAIGVISITVGSLGLIGGGLSAMYGGIFYLMAQTVARFNAVPVPTTPMPAVVTQSPSNQNQTIVGANPDPAVPDPPVEERGLNISTRQIIIDALAGKRPLNDARKRQLHALLARAGQDMFPSSTAAPTADSAAAAITESGQLPNPTDNDPNPGPDYFVIATGRIELTDDRALFSPSDSSQETIRVSAPSPSPTLSTASGASGSGGAATDQVAAAVRIVDQQTGNRLTQQQRQALTKEFTSSSGLVVPSSGLPIASQISSSVIQPDGSVYVFTPHGQIQIGTNGAVQSQVVYGGGTTTYTYHSYATSTIGKAPRISMAPLTLIVIEGTASVLLSIYLLVIGIFTLRQTRLGRRLHMIFALLKIPLAILCGIGWCWLIGEFMSSVPQTGGTSPLLFTRLFVLCLVTGAALLYPIALLIAFQTRSVKSYYDSGLQ